MDSLKAAEPYKRISELEGVLSCLLDHYLSNYECNDGDAHSGQRDRLSADAEALVPNWRERRDAYTPQSR